MAGTQASARNCPKIRLEGKLCLIMLNFHMSDFILARTEAKKNRRSNGTPTYNLKDNNTKFSATNSQLTHCQTQSGFFALITRRTGKKEPPRILRWYPLYTHYTPLHMHIVTPPAGTVQFSAPANNVVDVVGTDVKCLEGRLRWEHDPVYSCQWQVRKAWQIAIKVSPNKKVTAESSHDSAS